MSLNQNAEPEAVQRQLERITVSRPFARSEQMCRFLRFVVDASLTNSGSNLKETVVAMQVFNRGSDYNPAADPVVRVEARRLRSKLEEYYAGEGRDDAIRISLPKGQYAPLITVVSTSISPREGKWRAWRARFVVASAVLLTFALVFAPRRAETPSIAVLPFVDRSPDRSLSWFSDALSEQLISALGRIEGLRVTARTSSFQYRGGSADLKSMAATLKVRYLVDGSVRVSGERLRIAAQLIAMDSGYQMWSRTYERRVGEIFALQDEITGAIRNALNLRIAPGHPHPPTESDEAMRLYFQGRRSWYANDFSQSAALFQQAIELDPGFAWAHAGLARSYGRLETNPKIMAAAESAARRALEIDETLTEARIVLGTIRLRNWDWAGAEREFRTAIARDPRSADARGEYAIGYLAPTGQIQEALKESARSIELDPMSPIENIRHGVLLTYARRYREAETQFRKTLALAPDLTRRHLGRLYLATERYDEALKYLSDDATWRAIGLARAGRPTEARQISISNDNVYSALYWAATGNLNRAFEVLNQGLHSHAMALTTMEHPVWDPLRQDLRFAAILREMGLHVRT